MMEVIERERHMCMCVCVSVYTVPETLFLIVHICLRVGGILKTDLVKTAQSFSFYIAAPKYSLNICVSVLGASALSTLVNDTRHILFILNKLIFALGTHSIHSCSFMVVLYCVCRAIFFSDNNLLTSFFVCLCLSALY